MHEEVLPVCAPGLLGQTEPLAPQDIAELPLLQQSTRPFGWSQWFDAMGMATPHALSGPRYELFSMTASAAIHGLGVALLPRLLIEAELARGDLVVACDQPLRGERAYYLVVPQRDGDPDALALFRKWLVSAATSPVRG